MKLKPFIKNMLANKETLETSITSNCSKFLNIRVFLI